MMPVPLISLQFLVIFQKASPVASCVVGSSLLAHVVFCLAGLATQQCCRLVILSNGALYVFFLGALHFSEVSCICSISLVVPYMFGSSPNISLHFWKAFQWCRACLPSPQQYCAYVASQMVPFMVVGYPVLPCMFSGFLLVHDVWQPPVQLDNSPFLLCRFGKLCNDALTVLQLPMQCVACLTAYN